MVFKLDLLGFDLNPNMITSSCYYWL